MDNSWNSNQQMDDPLNGGQPMGGQYQRDFDSGLNNYNVGGGNKASTPVFGIIGIMLCFLCMCCCGIFSFIPIIFGIIDIVVQRKKGGTIACGVIAVVVGSIEMLVAVVYFALMIAGSNATTYSSYFEPSIFEEYLYEVY